MLSKLPEHIAIIMDGNGRWAHQRKLPRSSGHQAGVKTIRKIVEHCARLEINALTVYAFSSENWQRPQKEVTFLMELFVRALRGEVDKLHENNICVKFIGELNVFPANLQSEIHIATEKTSENTGMKFTIAVNYGGRQEITNAMLSIASEVEEGKLASSQIDEELITSRTWLSDSVEPDLFVRTGGEQRLSNFLLWHLAYTELFFTNTLWPDFSSDELDAAIAVFCKRQRRFGQTGEQVESDAQSGG